jgi:glycerol-3-phosphate dehydrogenase (NAD(P)+)
MTASVTVLGDGQMGLVLSDALAERGAAVRLWGPFPEDLAELAASRQSPKRLPDFTLPAAVAIEPDAAAALDGADVVLNAIPTQFIRRVWSAVGAGIAPGTPVVCVSKGVEADTLLSPSDVIAESLHEVDGRSAPPVCALSGPTIARELARRLPAAMVAASTDPMLAERVQDLFGAKWLRIYRHDDVVGVEIAGATKNVIALAAGIVDGLDVGQNAKSALLARGLAEIARLGAAMGARVETFFGIAGVGDLATTCFSPFSRNRTCGERLGRGESLQAILDSTVSVVEGVATTPAARELATRHGVEMPIADAVHGILFEDLSPMDAIWSLMGREAKAEEIG